jgi:hypothetical protein
MLIPQGSGSTKTVNLSSAHFAMVVGLLSILAFTSAFLLQRTMTWKAAASDRLEDLAKLEFQEKTQATETVVVQQGLSDTERDELKRQVWEEYEERYQMVTVKLNELLDLEAKAREITGIESNRSSLGEFLAAGGGGGEGGPPGGLEDAVDAGGQDTTLPPHLIYGVARPSLDLIVQEIELRAESLRALLLDMDKQREAFEAEPTAWPSKHSRRKITSRYGLRKDPFTKRLRRHSGTDISAPRGSAVLATAAGTVSYSGWDKYLGNVVKIDHGNGFETWYGHMSKRSVKKGAKLKRGDTIGTVGSTGRSTGPHIHYEVHKKGATVNPEKFIGAR